MKLTLALPLTLLPWVYLAQTLKVSSIESLRIVLGPSTVTSNLGKTLSETVKVVSTIPSDSRSALILQVPRVGSSPRGIESCARPFFRDMSFHCTSLASDGSSIQMLLITDWASGLSSELRSRALLRKVKHSNSKIYGPNYLWRCYNRCWSLAPKQEHQNDIFTTVQKYNQSAEMMKMLKKLLL